MNPVGLSIELTSRCNAACIMCPRTLCDEWDGRDMATEDVLRVAREGIDMGVEIIHPHHFGEPTLHADYPLILRELRAMSPDLTIKTFTNGSRLLRDDVVTAIREYATICCVSVDGWSPQTMAKMRPGVEPMDARRGVANLCLPGRNCTVYTQMVVVVGENDHEQEGYVEFWKGLGVDHPLIGPDLRTDTVKAPNPCSRLWSAMTVRVDGTVTPCCHDVKAEHVYGNAFTDGLRACWEGDRARAFRAAHRSGEVPMCLACTWAHTFKGEIHEERDGGVHAER